MLTGHHRPLLLLGVIGIEDRDRPHARAAGPGQARRGVQRLATLVAARVRRADDLHAALGALVALRHDRDRA
jgi:hypothetical protein